MFMILILILKTAQGTISLPELNNNLCVRDVHQMAEESKGLGKCQNAALAGRAAAPN